VGWRQYASRRRIIIIGYGKKEGEKKQGKEIKEKKKLKKLPNQKTYNANK